MHAGSQWMEWHLFRPSVHSLAHHAANQSTVGLSAHADLKELRHSKWKMGKIVERLHFDTVAQKTMRAFHEFDVAAPIKQHKKKSHHGGRRSKRRKWRKKERLNWKDQLTEIEEKKERRGPEKRRKKTREKAKKTRIQITNHGLINGFLLCAKQKCLFQGRAANKERFISTAGPSFILFSAQACRLFIDEWKPPNGMQDWRNRIHM